MLRRRRRSDVGVARWMILNESPSEWLLVVQAWR
jgi:hypothetical protein